MNGEQAWRMLTDQWNRDRAAHAAYTRKKRRRAAVAGDGFPVFPALSLMFEGPPPRHTLQSGRGVRVQGGRPMFFTKKSAREEAEETTWKIRTALPEDWKPRGGAVKLEVILAYPARRGDKLAGAAMAFHTQRPDIDNVLKGAILDSLPRAGVILDDAQVCDLVVRKRRSALPFWGLRVWFAESKPETLGA